MINSLFAKQVDSIIFMGYHLTEESCRIFLVLPVLGICQEQWTSIFKITGVSIDYKAAVEDSVHSAKNNEKRLPLYQDH